MAELCRRFGISRMTGYKWVSRYQDGGVEALRDRSHAPHNHPFQVLEAVEEAVLAVRSEHPQWGPVKLRLWLDQTAPEVEWPAASTIGEILRRNGLTVPRKSPQNGASGTSNQTWNVAVADRFQCLDGREAFPLTVTDSQSGFLLRCQGLARLDTGSVRRLFAAAFREYGLPRRIRVPGMPPFFEIGGLSELTVWWIRLAIQPVAIDPGKSPGRRIEEPVLRPLRLETAQPRSNLREQQKALHDFRSRYNQTACPDYQRSARPYPSRTDPVAYPSNFEVRRVQAHGFVRWNNARIFVSRALAGEAIGLELTKDRKWRAWFGFHRLGELDGANRLTQDTNTIR
jgi:transposase